MTKICFCIPQGCTECFQMEVDFCPETILLEVGLTPGDALYLFVRDKFDNIYIDPVTVMGDGSIEIILANFPTGMFSPNFGMVEIFVATDEDATDIVTMNTVPASTCINLTVLPPVYFIEEDGCKIFVEENNEDLFIEE